LTVSNDTSDSLVERSSVPGLVFNVIEEHLMLFQLAKETLVLCWLQLN